jgi:hypothetical protein
LGPRVGPYLGTGRVADASRLSFVSLSTPAAKQAGISMPGTVKCGLTFRPVAFTHRGWTCLASHPSLVPPVPLVDARPWPEPRESSAASGVAQSRRSARPVIGATATVAPAAVSRDARSRSEGPGATTSKGMRGESSTRLVSGPTKRDEQRPISRGQRRATQARPSKCSCASRSHPHRARRTHRLSSGPRFPAPG